MLSVALASCTRDALEDLPLPDAAGTESFKISPEEAQAELASFMAELEGTGSHKLGVAPKRFAKVRALRRDMHVRSIGLDDPEVEDIDIDTLMYAINFADNQGFALVAADRRTSPILAIVDEGNFHPDSLTEDADEGFLSFVSDAIHMELQDIQGYEKTFHTTQTQPGDYTIVQRYKPMLHTKWGQGGDYGKYCPNRVAGCVMVAIAQILSYYQTVSRVSWSDRSDNGTSGASDLHWDRIIADCDRCGGKLGHSSCAASADEVAHLLRYLGVALGAEYKKKGVYGETGAKSSNAIDWFNKWGLLNATPLTSYNESAIIAAIKSRNLVYGRGATGKKKFLGIKIGYKGGHAWVYDGALITYKDGTSTNYVHCNWGWDGNKNGYYLSRVFDTNAGPVSYAPTDNRPIETIDDTVDPYPYFCYKLEYSIITRKN